MDSDVVTSLNELHHWGETLLKTAVHEQALHIYLMSQNTQ